jgi:hypothetical protein
MDYIEFLSITSFLTTRLQYFIISKLMKHIATKLTHDESSYTQMEHFFVSQ